MAISRTGVALGALKFSVAAFFGYLFFWGVSFMVPTGQSARHFEARTTEMMTMYCEAQRDRLTERCLRNGQSKSLADVPFKQLKALSAEHHCPTTGTLVIAPDFNLYCTAHAPPPPALADRSLVLYEMIDPERVTIEGHEPSSAEPVSPEGEPSTRPAFD